ncbi:MAG: ribonuclease Y [Deltaproteobacteria bacterium]|nr:ribonuclease Y [Deltaproteobacteria bacterium]
MISIWILVGGAGLGLVIGFLVRHILSAKEKSSEQNRLKLLAEEAEARARTIQKEAEVSAKDLLLKTRLQAEEESKSRRRDLEVLERKVGLHEEELERRRREFDNREQDLRRLDQSVNERRGKLDRLEAEYGQLVEKTKKGLEQIAGLSSEEAKKRLMDEMISEARHEAAREMKRIEDEATENAEREGKKIISMAIGRIAGDWVQESTTAAVKLPSDDMKGRVIGREGRNIRTLEALTGVDLIIDDTPGAVILSCHNPVRREIARITLEKLLQDGRIHPARIEEILKKVTQDVEKGIKEAGQQALLEMDIHGVHPEIARLLGTLKYRYSYAQNVLQHSIEVGFFCGMMGAELGLKPKVARRAGLLHDIGKALSHEIEGSHAVIGGEFAKKYGELPEVVHGIWAHHEDIPQESVLDHLVEAADALSGARPGARMEQAEAYVKRLEDLETIAYSFENVEKAYAIQAGRELRVMVEPDKISDDGAVWLCKDISKRIEKELTYPGQIRVMVIREKRAVEFAK